MGYDHQAVASVCHAEKRGRGMAKAVWAGTVIAETDDPVIVEGNAYFPSEAADQHYLRPSPRQTTCPWKGVARYYDVVVDGQVNKDAAWYYPEPKPAAEHIKDRIAFWKGVQVEG